VRIALTDAAFEPSAQLAAFIAAAPGAGAVVSFTGLCRPDPGVIALELEAYPGFTEGEIAREGEQVIAQHGLLALEVLHRVGRMLPGEAVVWVAAAAPHRRAAFEGCDRMMDHLKSRAPFWKREHTTAGPRWIEPTTQDYVEATRWDAPALHVPPETA
jgi:molybdopterin synthase catalytic subunit